MSDQLTNAKTDRLKAAELYVLGRKLEAQEDYEAAFLCYGQSLELYEDETVKAAYFHVLSAIGPK